MISLIPNFFLTSFCSKKFGHGSNQPCCPKWYNDRMKLRIGDFVLEGEFVVVKSILHCLPGISSEIGECYLQKPHWLETNVSINYELWFFCQLYILRILQLKNLVFKNKPFFLISHFLSHLPSKTFVFQLILTIFSLFQILSIINIWLANTFSL